MHLNCTLKTSHVTRASHTCWLLCSSLDLISIPYHCTLSVTNNQPSLLNFLPRGLFEALQFFYLHHPDFFSFSLLSLPLPLFPSMELSSEFRNDTPEMLQSSNHTFFPRNYNRMVFFVEWSLFLLFFFFFFKHRAILSFPLCQKGCSSELCFNRNSSVSRDGDEVSW